jgi:hypothetical protein
MSNSRLRAPGASSVGAGYIPVAALKARTDETAWQSCLSFLERMNETTIVAKAVGVGAILGAQIMARPQEALVTNTIDKKYARLMATIAGVTTKGTKNVCPVLWRCGMMDTSDTSFPSSGWFISRERGSALYWMNGKQILETNAVAALEYLQSAQMVVRLSHHDFISDGFDCGVGGVPNTTLCRAHLACWGQIIGARYVTGSLRASLQGSDHATNVFAMLVEAALDPAFPGVTLSASQVCLAAPNVTQGDLRALAIEQAFLMDPSCLPDYGTHAHRIPLSDVCI